MADAHATKQLERLLLTKLLTEATRGCDGTLPSTSTTVHRLLAALFREDGSPLAYSHPHVLPKRFRQLCRCCCLGGRSTTRGCSAKHPLIGHVE